MKNKYYAYFVPVSGSKSIQGITEDWKKCEKIVSGKTGARFKGFSNKAEAEKWMTGGAIYEAKKSRAA